MSRLRGRKLLSWLGLSAILALALPNLGWSQESCGATCAPFIGALCGPRHHGHCPPALKYIYEGAPNIHWHCGCPHPICNPCELPNWGYYETCWTPFPFPPNWSHCPTPPPAAFVHLNPYGNVRTTPAGPPIRTVPAPATNPPLTFPPNEPQPQPSEEFPTPRRFN